MYEIHLTDNNLYTLKKVDVENNERGLNQNPGGG